MSTDLPSLYDDCIKSAEETYKKTAEEFVNSAPSDEGADTRAHFVNRLSRDSRRFQNYVQLLAASVTLEFEHREVFSPPLDDIDDMSIDLGEKLLEMLVYRQYSSDRNWYNDLSRSEKDYVDDKLTALAEVSRDFADLTKRLSRAARPGAGAYRLQGGSISGTGYRKDTARPAVTRPTRSQTTARAGNSGTRQMASAATRNRSMAMDAPADDTVVDDRHGAPKISSTAPFDTIYVGTGKDAVKAIRSDKVPAIDRPRFVLTDKDARVDAIPRLYDIRETVEYVCGDRYIYMPLSISNRYIYDEVSKRMARFGMKHLNVTFMRDGTPAIDSDLSRSIQMRHETLSRSRAVVESHGFVVVDHLGGDGYGNINDVVVAGRAAATQCQMKPFQPLITAARICSAFIPEAENARTRSTVPSDKKAFTVERWMTELNRAANLAAAHEILIAHREEPMLSRALWNAINGRFTRAVNALLGIRTGFDLSIESFAEDFHELMQLLEEQYNREWMSEWLRASFFIAPSCCEPMKASDTRRWLQTAVTAVNGPRSAASTRRGRKAPPKEGAAQEEGGEEIAIVVTDFMAANTAILEEQLLLLFLRIGLTDLGLSIDDEAMRMIVPDGEYSDLHWMITKAIDSTENFGESGSVLLVLADDIRLRVHRSYMDGIDTPIVDKVGGKVDVCYYLRYEEQDNC